MTYVFFNEENGVHVVAYGNDLYNVAIDLDLSEGRYLVYETDLMPDQIDNPKLLAMQGKLKYVTLLTRCSGA